MGRRVFQRSRPEESHQWMTNWRVSWERKQFHLSISSLTLHPIPSTSPYSPPLHLIHNHNHTPTPSQYLTSPPTTSLPYTHPHVPTFLLTHLCTSPLTLTSPTLKMTPLYLTHPHTRPYSPSKPTLPPQFHPLTPHFCTHPPFSQHPYTTPLPSHMHYTSPPSHMHHTSVPPTLTITTTPTPPPPPHLCTSHFYTHSLLPGII